MPNRRSHTVAGIVIAAILFFALVALSLSGTTWAAPNAQGTVPTAVPPTSPAGSGNGGGNGGGGDGGGGGNGSAVATATPRALPAIVCVIGEEITQCVFDVLWVLIRAGTVAAGSALTIEGPFTPPPCPPSPANFAFLNRCYRFTWLGTNAQPITALAAPVQYCYTYSAAELALAQNKADNLLVGFAGADGVWTVVKPTVDAANARICAVVDKVYAWSALFTAQPTLLPVTGGREMSLAVLLIAITGLGVAGAGLCALRRA